jgi:acyl transferase domain-containing protein
MLITSVKPNLGHTEGASGLTSLIKAVLALEHGIIPPDIKFSAPNPDIPWDSGRFFVPQEPTPWPANKRNVFPSTISGSAVPMVSTVTSLALHTIVAMFNTS